ncbi:hypothetical protein Tco_0426294, partial [Tanacetum coccineum]
MEPLIKHDKNYGPNSIRLCIGFDVDHEQKSQEHKRIILHPQEVSLEEKVQRFGVFEIGVHQMHHDALARHPIHSWDVIDWEFLTRQGLDQTFFESINNEPFSGLEWIGGEKRGNTLLELEWRVSLYTEIKSWENATLSGLCRAETVKVSYLLAEFLPSIGEGGFNVGKMKVASIRDLKVKLAIGSPILISATSIASTLNRLLTNKMMDALSVEPLPHPATREVKEDDEVEEANKGEAGNEGAGGSADMYRYMSQGDWQVRQ